MSPEFFRSLRRRLYRLLFRHVEQYEAYAHSGNDPIYKRMILRRRFFKRASLLLIAFAASFYVSVLTFSDLHLQVMHLTDLDRCPVCYGVSICGSLYADRVVLEPTQGWHRLFNAKNIYHAYTRKNGRKIILKKLAHDKELKVLDTSLCKTWGLKRNCGPRHLLGFNVTFIQQKVKDTVKYDILKPDVAPRKGLVFCPYVHGLHDFLKPLFPVNPRNGLSVAEWINIWTMVNVNPEPIILQVIPRSLGWPVPQYGGVCGRVEVVAHNGEPLSSLLQSEVTRKLQIAMKILDAAVDFTFRHERFRFYLMDWSLDNIVVNEKNEVTFVDLEDVIVVDKRISPGEHLPDWYKQYTREKELNNDPQFSFSIDKICKHHLSDHNLWAACFILAADGQSFLQPSDLSYGSLKSLFRECLTSDNRFDMTTRLKMALKESLVSMKPRQGLRRRRRHAFDPEKSRSVLRLH